jgi:HD-GYP domain-containing protein (c-di-GMP phosphodiesterase class II)
MVLEQETASAAPGRSAAEDTIAAIARAMKNVSFYEPTHPAVVDVVKQIEADLHSLLSQEEEFVVKFSNGYVVVQDVPVLNQTASIGNLVGACHRRGVDTIVFRRGVDDEELSHLVEVLAADPEEVGSMGGIAEALAARGVRRILTQRLVSGADEESGENFLEWRWVYTTALDVLRGAAAEVRRGRPIDAASVQSSVHEIVDDIVGDRSIVYNLNWMKGMDEYTFVHALHISILAVELGREIGLPREQLEELGTSTLLHDVGKIFVPLEILRKPAALNEEEFAVISRHPIDGALVLAREPALPPVAGVVAFEHHMHLDHSGYPKMRRKRALNLYSLITSVVDVYDALTTMRPYRPPLTPRAAVAVIRDQYKGRLEPRLLGCFLRLLGPYPWGSLLRLDEGGLVVVSRPNPAEPDNPLARVVEAGGGNDRVLEGESHLRDLTRRLDKVAAVDPVELGINLTALLHRTPEGAGGQ